MNRDLHVKSRTIPSEGIDEYRTCLPAGTEQGIMNMDWENLNIEIRNI